MEAARVARADDVERLVALARASRDELAPMRGGDLWDRRERRPEPLDAAYRELLGRDDACVLVGTIDDAVVGVTVVELEELRTGERLAILTDLFVEAEARSVGVGEAMLEAALAWCDERRCIGVDATVLPGHRAAKNFFEGAGFTARALVMHRRSGPPG